MGFEGLDELGNLLLLGLTAVLLILFILLIISHNALLRYKKECQSRKQTEQRLRDVVFDLRMRVKYQNDDLNNMFTSQKEIEHKMNLAATTDLSSQRKIEDMKVMLNEALKYEQIKAEFFANLSHELKTPLNVLISTLQLLMLIILSEQPESSNTNIQKYLNIMKQNCFRLLRLVNNMIDVTRIDTGFISLQLGNHNIVSIVEDVCMSVADYVKTRNINFVFDTEIEEMIIACDPDKIEKIILNILSNAVKFTDQGGLISVNVYCNDKYVTISVKDTGIGIPQDKLETIFERYKQLDKTLSRNYGGSGIGLSLVKSLVDMHNGKIWVKSAENRGSEFCVSLPVRISEREKPKIEIENGYAQQCRVEKITIEFSDIYMS